MKGHLMKPERRPERPEFSSGPCAKPPGWSLDHLKGALLGRSHRAKPSKQRLQATIDRSKSILEIPSDYRVGIVAASDTGAIEMALWSMSVRSRCSRGRASARAGSPTSKSS
jgi:phosphoserine aminotransferase